MFKSFDLNKLRQENSAYISKAPFEHQKDAFSNLSKIFTFDDQTHRSGLLVLPTGAGKTFTSINWICRNVLPKNVKVLWLAHTSHLLEQAYDTFVQNLVSVHSRDFINIRVVSSNPMHSTAAQIGQSDDILIITTQTAISNWNINALDGRGEKRKTSFEQFVEESMRSRLFTILDEAHHAPAYGCRNLLVGGSSNKKGIRDVIPHSYFLGLTATPTYSDERRRGWLFEIFNTNIFLKKGIIYEVDKADLIKQGILAVPKYIQKNTGEEFEVNDNTYNHIVREHNDLPAELVDKLASDSARNDYIVNEYVQNKEKYGKTLIFADRWFQCIYIKEKLKAKNIKVDAVYSHVDPSAETAEKRNVRTAVENAEILHKFKKNELDVLINVKMLTEGTDVPDISTVFITRQTTSSILLTQMIGRALRGKKAGAGNNKEIANIVFFTDNWKRVINFATPESDGSKEDAEIKIRGRVPMQFIAINLIEELSRKIDSGIVFSDKEFLEQMPIGWYETEALISVEEETNSFKEFVIVYQNTKDKFEQFIKEITNNLAPEWESESLDLDTIQPVVSAWMNTYFDEKDNINGTLDFDLIKLARHVAQSGKSPLFISFSERDQHDLSQIAFDAVQKRMDDLSIDELLQHEYNAPDKLWKLFYSSYDRFASAFDAERRRAIHKIKYNCEPSLKIAPPNSDRPDRELTEQEKEQVFIRDKYTCLCCGKFKGVQGMRVKLQVDHIVPIKFGGQSTIENSQTLCHICNNSKSVNEINFRIYKTPLTMPKNEIELIDLHTSETYDFVLRRIVNMFYHCQAVSEVRMDNRPRSKHQFNWEIQLFNGNNPEWLFKHNDALISFIQKGYPKLRSLTSS